MIGINGVGEELVEDLYIIGIGPSQQFKPMINEQFDEGMNIDDLKNISASSWWLLAALLLIPLEAGGKEINEENSVEGLKGDGSLIGRR
ncbi:hypothetical protein PMIT1342_00760 [Prochlorococcus marinus str. MIT 1342]|uniref:hypothetical protein n=2 Tax=Prochlorococcus TaxID=1218 RepID=UPI0007B3F625|nr:hypothetical protein [Prochlorococcus marinus]KZR82295.1 hypothetical protein PMIT1342_00760 [Prochlorococcus marinus str. MIT 1342]